GGGKKETGCCSLDSINDARTIAVQNGIHHLILDIRDEFGDFVIDNFVEEYLAGRTPNPCVLCNTHIKWEALLKRANQLDCEFIATGHYAQLRTENGRHVISRGLDHHKDQSYVLWGLSQESLSRTRFPLGGFHKTDIKQMAIDRGYLELAKKSESYEICFVPDNDYRGFLKRKVNGLEERLDGGLFVNQEGKILGKHRGYPFYTVGQRKGLEIALGEPMFVLEIKPETNTVVLGKENELQRNGMWVRNVNMQKYQSILDPMESLTKVRYKDAGTLATIAQEGNRMKVDFHTKVKGIAPGQSAVFYEGDDVIGGGWIQSSFDI
ncbi:MAG: tRNA 2-thiouridine(34) synthase MnmA, partial [Bacteroidota bacterium]|nr:tRNA 2-thiouridine(34) synthase MnmA [Bacteroidota bacterium]